MEAKNLRVGNWVEHPNRRADQVETILKTEHGYALRFKDYGVGYFMEHEGVDIIKPIALNDYWLEEFGFKNGKLGDIELCSLNIEHNCYTMDRGDKEVHYNITEVHQLQNLFFAITGEELEMNPKFFELLCR